MIRAPQIDHRDEERILQDLRRLQGRTYHRSETGLDAALARVFARYCSIIIGRVNQSPWKNQLAFVSMLEGSPIPPRPARVPLTFYLTPQAVADVLVPAGTQVAAKPEKDELTPVIFETAGDLPLSSLKLDSLFTEDPESDQFADYTGLLDPHCAEAVPILRGNQPIPHLFFIGMHMPPLAPEIAELRLAISFERPAAAPLWLSWEIWNGIEGIPLNPASDSTSSFSSDGEVRFTNLPPFPQVRVEGVTAQWLRCRLLSPLEPDSEPTLPILRGLKAHATTARQDLPLELALWNGSPLDITKDFYPLGERPRFGDTFFLSNDEAFSSPGAEVRISIELTNPASGGPVPPVPRVAAGSARLVWEYWDGWTWVPLDQVGLEDGTHALTQSGDVVFRLPRPASPLKLAGQDKRWIRVRLAGGDYFRQAVAETREPSEAAPRVPPHRVHLPGTAPPESPPPPPRLPSAAPPEPAPPVLHAVRVAYRSEVQLVPAGIVACNEFSCEDFDVDAGGIVPFVPAEGRNPAFYLGFSGPELAGSRPLNIYFGTWNPMQVDSAGSPGIPPLTWEYWNGREWAHLNAVDDTRALRSPGIVQLLIPAGAVRRSKFGRVRLWLRQQRREPLDFEPRLRMVAINTVIAWQAVTIWNETLGSSNGRPDQTFHTSHAPVLEGEVLDVLEQVASGGKAWITWKAVGGFYGSGPDDRHYLLDHSTGEVIFGDGARGAIPPSGNANLRMTRYQTGGGSHGNRPLGTISELKTTVPYVERVINLEASAGGADAETWEGLVERVPRELRHRGRAVTMEDYEDLAMQASTEVARAKCLPLVDLTDDPGGTRRKAGVVSLILVPRSAESNPLPTVALFDRVRLFLEVRRACSARLVLAGPDYARIDLTVEIAVTNAALAGVIEQQVARRLREFLHPVSGRGGAGADFGRYPQLAELYAVVEEVSGVDHVRSLDIVPDARPGRSAHFLVYPGNIAVSAVLE